MGLQGAQAFQGAGRKKTRPINKNACIGLQTGFVQLSLITFCFAAENPAIKSQKSGFSHPGRKAFKALP